MYDYTYSEEWIEEYIMRVNQLQFLLHLKSEGFEVNEYFFGYWSEECCPEEDPFIATVLAILFGDEVLNKILFENWDFGEWCEENALLFINEEDCCSDLVTILTVGDPNANSDLIPEIVESYKEIHGLIDLKVVEYGDGPAWCLAYDPYEFGVAEFFLHLRKIFLGKEEEDAAIINEHPTL